MIDELHRVRNFRGAEPPPSEAATAAARAALLQLIRAEVPTAASAGPEPARTRPSLRRVGHALGWYAWRSRVAIAVALGCAGIVVAGLLGSTTATSPASATAAALEQLARVAASQPRSLTPGPGQYLYTKSNSLTEVDTTGSTPVSTARTPICVVHVRELRESWIARNWSGAIRETVGHGRFTSARDRGVCLREGVINPNSFNHDLSIHRRYGRGGFRFEHKAWPALSTNPAKLLVQLRRIDGGPRTAREDFVHIGDFLRPQGQGGLPGAHLETDTPPAIRAALYRAAKLIPGVRLLGPTRDQAGRTGLGIAWFSHGRPRMELIFDRHTARLLDESTYEPSGQIADWTVYLETKIVNSLPTTP
jgi:hypothetical protein